MVPQALSALNQSQIADDAAFTTAHTHELQIFERQNHSRRMHSRPIPSNLDEAESLDAQNMSVATRGAADGYVGAECVRLPALPRDRTGNSFADREHQIVSAKLKKNPAWFRQRRHSALVVPATKGALMRKTILTLAAVAALASAAVAPAEARGFGRGAAVGLGIAGAAIGTAAVVNGYNDGYGPGYGYGPGDGYYADPGYNYDDGPRVYHRRYQRDYYDNW
jgi:hypothetical protein